VRQRGCIYIYKSIFIEIYRLIGIFMGCLAVRSATVSVKYQTGKKRRGVF
jgi:hypothetical protein